ncbi:MAG TPA: hypothetical protein DCE03_00895 [Synergistaceae bacterium]|jgi:hypothetical protein|nr:MAG: Glycosyltransferase [Synergistales bacterium 53_16]KUL02252.1 MAG: Glycosyltransferase [Synergistales bacterium 54_9]MDN5335409.1 hypothetical protein [Synergistales bacterium]HAA47041.1 hypothetical protein [Synergistaceae bacterium]HAG22759.1 hypothetical protein [Synergistaceae bacterium]
MFFLAGYKVYLAVYEKDFQSLNAVNIERIEKWLQGRQAYSFAVVGNIRNSMRIFEKRIVPLVRNEEIDFMVSAGNAVYDGAEDKYRLLYRGLGKLDIPYVLAVGHNELEDFGAPRFYRHFGPFFFSFCLGNAAFIFLDSTGRTSGEWLDRWLAQELEDAAGLKYRFVFLNDSPFAPAAPGNSKRHYLLTAGRVIKLYRRVLALAGAGGNQQGKG